MWDPSWVHRTFRSACQISITLRKGSALIIVIGLWGDRSIKVSYVYPASVNDQIIIYRGVRSCLASFHPSGALCRRRSLQVKYLYLLRYIFLLTWTFSSSGLLSNLHFLLLRLRNAGLVGNGTSCAPIRRDCYFLGKEQVLLRSR